MARDLVLQGVNLPAHPADVPGVEEEKVGIALGTLAHGDPCRRIGLAREQERIDPEAAQMEELLDGLLDDPCHGPAEIEAGDISGGLTRGRRERRGGAGDEQRDDLVRRQRRIRREVVLEPVHGSEHVHDHVVVRDAGLGGQVDVRIEPARLVQLHDGFIHAVVHAPESDPASFQSHDPARQLGAGDGAPDLQIGIGFDLPQIVL